VNAVQQDVHAILQLGESQIEKAARALIDAARTEADEKLSAELSSGSVEGGEPEHPTALKATVSRCWKA
jgi:hypothetical protein